MVSSTDGPHRPRCWAIIALSPRIGVYTATPSTSSKCETSAATGLPMDTPDTAIAVDCGRSHRTSGADLGDGAHHSCDVGQRVHVRIRRPRVAADAVARLDRQRDVEAQLVLDAPGSGEQQVDRLALAGSVHPHQPRPAVVAGSAQMRHSGRGPAETLGGQRAGKHRIVVERQLLVDQPAQSAAAESDFTRRGSGSVCARSTPSADSSSAAAAHELNERSSLGGGAVSVMPERANSSSTTSPSWRAPIGDKGFQSPELLSAVVRARQHAREVPADPPCPFRGLHHASLKPVYPASAISSHRRRYSGIPPV